MNCRDVLQVIDWYLNGELLTGTNDEILRHLDVCSLCCSEIDGRRRLRSALRGALDRAPELQSSAEFQNRLREQLRAASARAVSPRTLSWRSLALAAAVVLTVSLAGVVLTNRSVGPLDALARDAVGDHQNCALKYRLVRAPVPLEEAAQQFDRAYRLLLGEPPDDIPAPDGAAHVTERHSCAFGGRRFGHVIMEYQGRVVSLLMTGNDFGTASPERDAIPHVIGRPTNGLSVVSVNRAHYAILLVSDLDAVALTRLSRLISMPLSRRLEADLKLPASPVAALRPIIDANPF
jgi:anti-sigma factor RsiW